MTRRGFLSTSAAAAAPARRPPNIVLIYVDDMGYGDLGVYGHPSIRTPHVDRMAAEGIKFTSFYSTSALCTPSRAALLTGRYPIRSGMVRVLFPGEEFGLPASEVTVASLLQKAGYATGCIGKWHLGDLPRYQPRRHGFDFYYGLLYSNDMDARHLQWYPWPYPPSMYRNEEKIETPVNQETMTQRYTQEAVRFIGENRARPFFLYIPHSMVHWPHFASEKFRGRSRYGIYGDAVEEVDWSTGEVLRALRENGLDDNTLVIFTSDNGGATRPGAASNGPLRGGKGSMWEGGFREPFVARWPGRIPGGASTAEMACTMDLFATFLKLAGTAPPSDRPIDGMDVWSAFTGGPSPRKEFFYFDSNWDSNARLMAVRSGSRKLHVDPESWKPRALYDVERDPGETTDLAASEPAEASRLAERAREFRAGIKPGRQCPPLPMDRRPPAARGQKK